MFSYEARQAICNSRLRVVIRQLTTNLFRCSAKDLFSFWIFRKQRLLRSDELQTDFSDLKSHACVLLRARDARAQPSHRWGVAGGVKGPAKGGRRVATPRPWTPPSTPAS